MTLNVNGTILYYETYGAGEPMILLHGNGEDHHIFDKITEKLKESFTIYAIDSRNHGKSQQTDDYSYETMSEDIYCFIRKLQLGKVFVIGFSDGAIISLILSINHSECIKKMALLGVNLKPEDFTEECYEYIKYQYEETQNPLFKLMLEQPNIKMDEVRTVKIPTLVIAGEYDLYRPEMFTELTDTMPDAKLIIMSGYEHDNYIVNQDILYSNFMNFFI